MKVRAYFVSVENKIGSFLNGFTIDFIVSLSNACDINLRSAKMTYVFLRKSVHHCKLLKYSGSYCDFYCTEHGTALVNLCFITFSIERSSEVLVVSQDIVFI